MGERIFNFLIVYVYIFSGFQFANTHREIQTDRPIVGVIAQSTPRPWKEHLGGSLYIVASYVKFLEASGARVVPIRTDLSEEKIKKLFQSINGAIFPGGRVGLFNSGYANTSRVIFDLAMKTFDNGGYFPIMGMCLGHQFLATVVNGPSEIRIRTDAYNLPAPLNLMKDYRESKLFRNIPDYLVKSFNAMPITAHFHKYSLPFKLFQENNKLKDFYKVLTTNFDRKGTQFVSTLEARKYPFYSTQWHPEKCAFEWALKKKTPHDLTAIKLGQYISNFFVNEARFSSHKFASEKEVREALIYNYQPVYTGKGQSYGYEQLYIF